MKLITALALLLTSSISLAATSVDCSGVREIHYPDDESQFVTGSSSTVLKPITNESFEGYLVYGADAVIDLGNSRSCVVKVRGVNVNGLIEIDSFQVTGKRFREAFRSAETRGTRVSVKSDDGFLKCSCELK